MIVSRKNYKKLKRKKKKKNKNKKEDKINLLCQWDQKIKDVIKNIKNDGKNIFYI